MDRQDVPTRSAAFRKQREATWVQLNAIVLRAEKKGIRSLTAAQLEKLPGLYRSTLSSLTVARSISLDRSLREYLESLVARAWLCVYGPQKPVRRVLMETMGRRFARAFRSHGIFVVASAVLLLLGTLTGFLLTLNDMEWYDALLPRELAGDRNPASTTEELHGALYGSGGHGLASFAAQLFSRNSGVAILCFSLGFLLGIPTALLLFYNGLILGAFVALHHDRGLAVDVWGWLLPHGVTELLAIVIAGAAGLAIGHAILVPGRSTRADNLARTGQAVGPLVLGAVVMLVMAALLEGFFRQMVTWIPLRYAMVAMTTLFWGLYFAYAGRSER